MIKLNKLYAGYGRREVLHDISAEIPDNALTCIIGPNGCGKSTLLKCIAGLIRPSGGSVILDGTPLSALNRKQTALRTAYLAQSKPTPDMTVRQTVLHGRFPHLAYPRSYGTRDMEAALNAASAMGLDSVIDEPMSCLSGGMRQSAYLAMSLAQDACHILLDEPTTYLDVSSRFQLMDMLSSLASDGRSITAVLHDLTLALEYADRIIVMADGELVSSGSPADIVASGIIGRVFGVDVEKCGTDGGASYRYVHRRHTDG